MNSRGKVSFIAVGLVCVVLAVVFASQAQPAALTSPLALRQGEVRQVERDLEFTVHTASPVDLSKLQARPDFGSGKARYLCLSLEQKKDDGALGERVCLGDSTEKVGVIPNDAQDTARTEDGSLVAEVTQEGRATTLRLPLRELSLPAGQYTFNFISSDGSCGSGPGDKCVDQLPEDGRADFKLRTPALVKCVGAGEEVRSGPRDDKKVALTFDDGPGVSTEEILKILKDKRADGTFYLVGDFVEQNGDIAKKIARQGSEVANHSSHHDALPGLEDLERTSRLIKDATGVTPCTFRPPYGQTDASLVANAAKANMDTVLWDVDTEDWADGSTVESVVEGTKANTQPGSIILMHDGGDNRRDRTIAALPQIIDDLREKGYSFVTVSELIGNEITYRPLGKP